MPTKWFDWNKTDLTQFDALLVEGPSVSSASFSLVEELGLKWIEITVTAGAHANGALSQVALLVSATPPDACSLTADIVSVASVSPSNENIGGGVVARYTAVNAGYVVRLNNADASGSGNQLANKLNGTVGAPTIDTITGSGKQDDPRYDAEYKHGVRAGIAVEGETLLRMVIGEEHVITDPSSPHTSGKCGLWATCAGVAGTTTVRFRAICGYDLS